MRRYAAIPLIALLLVFASGYSACGPKNADGTVILRPGAVNAFDQQMYDTLMIAQGSIRQARIEVRDNYPQHRDRFNQVAAAYNTAQAAYKVYHEAAVKTPESEVKVKSEIAGLIGKLSELLASLGVGVAQVPAPAGAKL